jgi:hypothetical protein
MKKCGGRQQHFKNAAQLHQRKLDRLYKKISYQIMNEEWERQNPPEEKPDRITAAYIGEKNGRVRYHVKTDYGILLE